MARVIAYVDGFNLYFGLKSRGFRRYYWLDVAVLASTFMKSDQSLAASHYFTARIRDNGRNAADRQRQNRYIDALQARGVQVHEGHYLKKQRQCRACGATWPDYEEKMTDVNIAVQLFMDAFDDRFDVAFLLSADSDLTTPVARLRERFPTKAVTVLFPPGRHSADLKKVATGVLHVAEDKLRQSQLPNPTPSLSGFLLHRPKEWR